MIAALTEASRIAGADSGVRPHDSTITSLDLVHGAVLSTVDAIRGIAARDQHHHEALSVLDLIAEWVCPVAPPTSDRIAGALYVDVQLVLPRSFAGRAERSMAWGGLMEARNAMVTSTLGGGAGPELTDGRVESALYALMVAIAVAAVAARRDMADVIGSMRLTYARRIIDQFPYLSADELVLAAESRRGTS